MSFLQPFLAPMCLLALVLIIGLFIWVAQLNSRLTRQSKMVRQFFQGPEGEDLEGLLNRCIEMAESSAKRCEAAQSEVGMMSLQLGSCVQHFSLVRYDAFGDVTGQQSFSLAFLDANDNGVVISSIFGRTTSRTFGKMINNGQPEQTLSEEEREALLQALGQKAKREVA